MDAMKPYGDGTVNKPPPETVGAFIDRIWGKDIGELNEADYGRALAIMTDEFVALRKARRKPA